MFQLTGDEGAALRFQSGMSKAKGRGGRRYLPYVFTEQGVAMLSSVLRSKRAVQVNIEIMRTFVKLRRMLATHEDFARKLNALEKKYDSQFRVVFDAIRQLMVPPSTEPVGKGSMSPLLARWRVALRYAHPVVNWLFRCFGNYRNARGELLMAGKRRMSPFLSPF